MVLKNKTNTKEIKPVRAQTHARQWSGSLFAQTSRGRLPLFDARWRYVLRLPRSGVFRLLLLALEMQRRAKKKKKKEGFLLIMLWDTWVMKTRSYTDTAPNLMFWCLNLQSLFLPLFSPFTPFILWSHEQWIKYTVITKSQVQMHTRRGERASE